MYPLYQCRVCGSDRNNTTYTVREMMLGTGDEFEYFECGHCGCLQIGEFPGDIAKYYPDDYYSLRKPDRLRPLIRGQWLAYSLHGKSLPGRLISMHYGRHPLYCGRHPLSGHIKRARVKLEDSILDVGCGNGRLLQEMQSAGFSNLTGVDPYIQHDISGENGRQLLKKELHQVQDSYDFVMFHHSFEHMPEPLETLQNVYRVLKHNRFALIRIPVVPGYAWRKYGVNWAQLDAPRHLFLHSEKSMQILAKKADLEIADVVYDSNEFQFWGSEQYLKNIAHNSKNSYAVDPKNSIFSKDDIAAFQAKAHELNVAGDGDSACFFLYKR